MDLIRRLPFLFGSFMAVIAGFASYICGTDSRSIYIRMAVCMVVFYILGTFIKNTVGNIKKEITINEEYKRLKEKEEEAERAHVDRRADHKQGQKVNLVADDTNDEFSPMMVSRVITSKMKE